MTGALLALLAIQIGYCGPIKDLDAAKFAGFDYFELRTSEVAALSDVEYDKLAAQLKQIAMPTPAAYWFVPAEIKLTRIPLGPRLLASCLASICSAAFAEDMPPP